MRGLAALLFLMGGIFGVVAYTEPTGQWWHLVLAALALGTFTLMVYPTNPKSGPRR